MPNRPELLATCWLVVFVASLPVVAKAGKPLPSRPLFELALDLNGDGVTDLASLVLTNPQNEKDDAVLADDLFMLTDGEGVDLEIRLGKSGKAADPAQPADLRKAGIIDTERRDWVVPLATDDDGQLVVASASGPGSSHDVQQSMTISFQSGRWIVAGFSEFWEMNDWKGDVVETDIGGCTIDYASGTATINTSLDDTERLAGTFKPFALADWTDALRPSACRY